MTPLIRSRILPVAVLLILLAAGCGRHAPPPPPLDNPDRTMTSRFDSLGVAEFLLLDDEARARRATAADDDFRSIERHREELRHLRDLELTLDFSSSMHKVENPHDEKRVDILIQKLHRAVRTDPTHAEAWYELGHHLDLIGSYSRARSAFSGALAALPHDRRCDDPDDLDTALRTGAAWSCRDLGLWDEGLAWLDGRRNWGDRHQEQQLLRGLLLAGAGRFREAFAVSMDLQAISYPHYGYLRVGAGEVASGYGRSWIQAAAWLARGEFDLAQHALGFCLENRAEVPFMRRYWNDVGLIHELAGRPQQAASAYGLAVTGERVMMPYLPWDGFSVPPVIGGEPDVRVPFFTVFETSYFAGSRFAFAVQLLAECANAEDPAMRAARGRDAEEAFTLCIRRGIRPLEARALRGRTRYFTGDLGGAEVDLAASTADLAAAGTPDAGSLLVLGTIRLNDDRPVEALPPLEAAVDAEPDLAGAWRTYGAALAVLGRRVDALAAMDRALELDPGSSGAWYNRGLLKVESGDWSEASVDLGVALRLAPWNASARDLLQRASLELRNAGDGGAAALAAARADSVAGTIAALDDVVVEENPGTTVLVGGARRHRMTPAPPTDYAALADSLTVVHAATPSDGTRRELADALLRTGDTDGALALLEETWNDAIADEDLILLLRADRDRADASRALVLARSGVAGSRTRSADVWSLVAATCLDQGHREEGIAALERAIAADPHNAGLKAYREFLTSVGGS